MKNYGLITEKINEQDYLFGASPLKKDIVLKDGNWTAYLPEEEKQLHKYHDSFACVSYSALNVLETMFNQRIMNKIIDNNWLSSNGYIKNGKVNFDDYFIAKLSKTKCYSGNTFRCVADTIREYGLIPQQKHDQADSCKEWYKRPILDKWLDKGKEFKKRFQINYETVARDLFEDALKYSPLQVGVRAWYKKNDLYYNEVSKWNHAVEMFRPKTSVNYIFDSYNPFIKRLTNNYIFGYIGYAFYVKEKRKNMEIQLYKEADSPTVYAKGINGQGDGLYHPIGQERFVKMFVDDWNEVNVEIIKIPKDKKGDMIGDYGFIKRAFNNLFK